MGSAVAAGGAATVGSAGDAGIFVFGVACWDWGMFCFLGAAGALTRFLCWSLDVPSRRSCLGAEWDLNLPPTDLVPVSLISDMSMTRRRRETTGVDGAAFPEGLLESFDFIDHCIRAEREEFAQAICIKLGNPCA